jgi:hypothetical protein
MFVIPGIVVIVLSTILLSWATTPNYGPLGSAHEHAAFAIKLDGVRLDLSQPKYQLQSKLIHFEGRDGTTLHRHATGVTVGEFLKSIKMDVKYDCFTVNDAKQAEGQEQVQYCNDGIKTLRYFVNGKERETITGYVPNDKDRILIIYGSENSSDIQREIQALQNLAIKTT